MEPSTQPGRASQAAAACAPLTALPADVPTDPALHATISTAHHRRPAPEQLPHPSGKPTSSCRQPRCSPTGDAWTRTPYVPLGYEGGELPGRLLTAIAFPSGPARTHPSQRPARDRRAPGGFRDRSSACCDHSHRRPDQRHNRLDNADLGGIRAAGAACEYVGPTHPELRPARACQRGSRRQQVGCLEWQVRGMKPAGRSA
jgi:hypothetical protein